jgi:hypothetical protein
MPPAIPRHRWEHYIQNTQETVDAEGLKQSSLSQNWNVVAGYYADPYGLPNPANIRSIAFG